jgi:hypothetical protein
MKELFIDKKKSLQESDVKFVDVYIDLHWIDCSFSILSGGGYKIHKGWLTPGYKDNFFLALSHRDSSLEIQKLVT